MKMRSVEAQHWAGTWNEWLAARLTLLEAEMGHKRRGDEVARMRQELPCAVW
ncbi:DUF899 domain-containing protein [Acidicapsa acidisoli]|uniref:DUF899 domain-containing protein n=1 Tax=Acidicapsa acidisoli TaxID=1615681 RepID=UPI0021E0A0F3|nr:DUF899 domain-containing protein [Acidicapsa acidisoli]